MTPGEEHLNHQRQHEVIMLQAWWDEHYEIGWDWDPEMGGEFVAVRREGGATIFAPTAGMLRQTMILDRSLRTAREGS